MKKQNLTPEITFDDVLLLPGYSTFEMNDDVKKVSLKTRVSKNLTIDIPITSSPMPGLTEENMAIAIGKLGGLGFIHPFQSKAKQLAQLKKVKKHKVKVAVSVVDLSLGKGIDHVKKVYKAGADMVCVETSHAHNKQTIEFIKKIKKINPKIEVCASLVVTGKATEALIKAGADSIRVGIGGGSHCTTRLVTGVGRPQLSAVEECYKVAKKYNVPIISDTGIKYAGDITKALVFGGESVMIGGLLTGTDECPGEIIEKKGKKYKHSWGMCTREAITHNQPFFKNPYKFTLRKIKKIIKIILGIKQSQQKEEFIFEEGVGELIPYKGSVDSVVEDLVSGIKRSMWYLGVSNISQLQKKTKWVTTSSNTNLENIPRI
ncbi:guanosine monophosphate reductase [Candidatus Woesearchaeota archaeon]|jgi:IMP dehydrogenase|nr:guanosine monophosphate reductase [Candidatus Paceibacterota bacterium]MBT6756377.1 guanosine monophosphate reductase [Candidatus Paceibacterota bacterium]MBT6921328.1 guanosine monophosphate reductase [Candidatus Paceibacterota bacterium]MBT7237475.1 guanosine monophosphate reductase [Candidatus Woesearchaeota archaeon]